MMQEHLGQRTLSEYEWYLRRWEADGQPDPQEWLKRLGAHGQRNARAALLRAGVAEALRVDHAVRKVPQAFTTLELAKLRRVSPAVHVRCLATLDLLYGTGARISEAEGIASDDVTTSHMVLRRTKRRPGGLRVERAIPLSALTAAAARELRALPAGRMPNLLGVRAHTVQDWMRELEDLTGIRTHAISSERRSAPT